MSETCWENATHVSFWLFTFESRWLLDWLLSWLLCWLVAELIYRLLDISLCHVTPHSRTLVHKENEKTQVLLHNLKNQVSVKGSCICQKHYIVYFNSATATQRPATASVIAHFCFVADALFHNTAQQKIVNIFCNSWPTRYILYSYVQSFTIKFTVISDMILYLQTLSSWPQDRGPLYQHLSFHLQTMWLFISNNVIVCTGMLRKHRLNNVCPLGR